MKIATIGLFELHKEKKKHQIWAISLESVFVKRVIYSYIFFPFFFKNEQMNGKKVKCIKFQFILKTCLHVTLKRSNVILMHIYINIQSINVFLTTYKAKKNWILPSLQATTNESHLFSIFLVRHTHCSLYK